MKNFYTVVYGEVLLYHKRSLLRTQMSSDIDTIKTLRKQEVGDSRKWETAGSGRQQEVVDGRKWETALNGRQQEVGDSRKRETAGSGRQQEAGDGRKREVKPSRCTCLALVEVVQNLTTQVLLSLPLALTRVVEEVPQGPVLPLQQLPVQQQGERRL